MICLQQNIGQRFEIFHVQTAILKDFKFVEKQTKGTLVQK